MGSKPGKIWVESPKIGLDPRKISAQPLKNGLDPYPILSENSRENDPKPMMS
jgi:hypothetical protein